VRILVVDDDPTALLLAEAVVRAAGHEVQTAQDGEQAFAVLSGEDVDVVVTDAQMPGISGFELAMQVRRDVRRYLYVIMLTALHDDEERLAGMRAGVDDYLTKPLRPATLSSQLIAAERVVALHRTIEEQRRVLERQATHDPLTGVYNRLRLDDDLEDLLARLQRYGHQFCVALLDVDRFKAYNDSYGHLAGDEALRTVAAVLSSTVRTGDAVYRYGGEEFLLLLPDQDLSGATVAVQRVRQAVRAAGLRHAASEHGVVTVSGGLAQCLDGTAGSGTALLEAADQALFLAKAQGRDSVVAAPGVPERVVRA
jgi:two-component system chemotaxis response regulator CheY